MSAHKRIITILIALVLLAGLVGPASAEKEAGSSRPIASPFGETGELLKAGIGGGTSLRGGHLDTVGYAVDVGAALMAGANYVRRSQADVTEDNATNGSPDTDPDDAGWDWVLTPPAFTHSATASEDNLYGETAIGVLDAYLRNPQPGYMTVLQDVATKLMATPTISTSSDLVFLMKFQDLPGVTASIYKDEAKSRYDARIAEKGSATLFAQYVRDVRGVTQGLKNGIIPWDLSGWVRVAQMLADRYVDAYATHADEIAEVAFKDSFGDDPDYFDFDDGRNEGWNSGYANSDFWWYTIGVESLMDMFHTADAHTDKLTDLAAHLADCRFASGAYSYSYKANPTDEDWQTTAFVVVTLADLDAPNYRSQINAACYWLASQQDPSGGWIYSDNTHYPEVGGECTEALYYGQQTFYGSAVAQVWEEYASNPVLTGSYAFDPCVINDSGTYKMWYTHVDDSENWRIYYATSTDGTSWSTGVEVLGLTGDETKVAGASVIKDGKYKMWYGARDATTWTSIRYAESDNGISWTKTMDGANPKKVLLTGAGGSWDSQMVREACVIKDGDAYKMWYAGCAAWPVFKIGYATSTDGTTWTKHASNPIFIGTPSGWDGFQVYAPSVVKEGSTYHMYFSGTDNSMSQVWSTGYASSGDGVLWAEASRNPILIPDVLDSLDYVGALNDAGTWKMWYSYVGASGYQIGLATLGTSTELYLSPAVASIRNDGSATQVYTVRIANAVDLYGYQFQVQFPPDKLEATAAAFDDSFFSTTCDSPGGWNATIDNVAGTVSFARTRLNSVPPELAVTGSGPLATVTFKSKDGAAVNRIDFVAGTHILGDIDGNPLAHSTQHAWLTTYNFGTLEGKVDLQGRSDESGAVVTVMSASGYYATTGTDSGGNWQFTNIPVGDYQVNAEMARYLDAQKGASGGGVTVTGGTTTLKLVKLLGGDVDDNDQISIGDLTAIGGVFGLSVPSGAEWNTDINDDDVINILDLVLAAGNYGKFSITNVPWPD
jgi:hypothetical protein